MRCKMDFMWILWCAIGLFFGGAFVWAWIHSQPPAPGQPPIYTEGAAYDACLEPEPRYNVEHLRYLHAVDQLQADLDDRIERL